MDSQFSYLRSLYVSAKDKYSREQALHSLSEFEKKEEHNYKKSTPLRKQDLEDRADE